MFNIDRCTGLVRYAGQMAAQGAIGRMRIAGHTGAVKWYRCVKCHGYHLLKIKCALAMT